MAKASVVDCTVCGKGYRLVSSKSGNYCSMQCYRAWQRSPDFVPGRKQRLCGQCEHCKKDVYGRTKGKRRSGVRSEFVFCDRKCYDDHRSKIIERRGKEGVPCGYCGKHVSKTSGRQKKYCNEVCWKANKKAGSKNCVGCGCWFTAVYFSPDRPKATSIGSRKTCSEECLRKFYREDEARKQKISKAFRGDKHPNWQGGPAEAAGRSYRGPGWSRIRKEMRKRDDYTCQHCGVNEEDYGRAMEVHHKMPFNQFGGRSAMANRPSNLISLCKSCHQTAEWEWRRNNQVQMCLPLNGASSSPKKSKYPSDLTGMKVNDVTVTTKVPAKSKTTKWAYDCHRCGGSGEAFRQVFVEHQIQDCGCGTSERKSVGWARHIAERKNKWHVMGVEYDRCSDAARVHGVGGATIAQWCKGRRSKGRGVRKTIAVNGWLPPREGCWYGPSKKSKEAA